MKREIEAVEKRTCLLVLGMHRSGTSALTRMLNIAGAALPTVLMGASEGNLKGHWESDVLVQYHDVMLNELGSFWNDWQSLDLSSLSIKRRLEIKQEIINIIASEFAQAPLFVVKDPRICRFAPLFIEALNEAGIGARTILPFRNPLEVCESLETRDGMKRTDAALLWLRHVLDAERASRNINRAFVAYNHLLDDWESTYNKISDRLELEGMYTIDEMEPQISEFLSNELRHHARKTEDVLLDPVLRDWAGATYESLLVLERNPGSKKAMAKLDQISGEFDQASPIMYRFYGEVRKERETEVTILKENLAGAQGRNAELNNALIHQKRQPTGVKSALTKLKKNIEKQERELARSRKEVARLKIGLEAERDLAGEQIRAYENSTSWRITAPMRSVKYAFSAITCVNNAFDLLAARPLQLINAEDHGGEVRPTSNNPQVIINLEKPLSPGWYVGKAQIEVKKGTCYPRLYFDLGNGCKEYTSARMIPTSRQNEYSTTFFLPIETSMVRFDPTDDLTSFTIHGLELKRMTTIRKIILLGGLGFTQLRSNPRHMLTRITQYRTLSKQQSVLDLTAKLQPAETGSDYQKWIARFDYDDNRDRAKLTELVEALSHKPLISVVMPVYNTPAKLLDEAIQSVVDQVYPHWELCIANDASPKKHVHSQLDRWAVRDKRIKVMHRAKNGHISRTSNSAIKLAKGEWIALLDHDDLLRENALAEVAIEINRHPDVEIIYSDEDKLDDKGRRYEPYFKPDFSRELFRSQNYLNHLTLHKAKHIKTVGGWRAGYEGSQDYDLNLRIFEIVDEKNIRHIPKVLYHWRAVAGSTAVSGMEKSYAYNAGKRALEDHIARIRLDAVIEEPEGIPFYRVRVAVPKPEPLVSLIIPTKDELELLRNCIESIYEKTDYWNYEIIVVDNNTEDPATLAYMDQIAKRDKLRVLRYPHPFNFSAINNFAVNQAKGSIIGLINNDIEVISTDWLTEMTSWATQPEIGCVGAKLYYGNDTIQHAGVILGLGGVAGHSHKNYAREQAGYFFRLKLPQNLSAVTAACLLVRKSVYEQVGGLNETDLTIAFNDVDFCLKVRQEGYQNVWTPYAELYHLESVTRGKEDNPDKQARYSREIDYMKRTWGVSLTTDPYYSPHLTRDREDFSLRN